jgi:hypothetical protein
VLPAALFALVFLTRTVLDWRSPTSDFHARSTATTLLSAGIFLIAGFRAGVRSRTFLGGTVSGLVTAVFALPIQLVGAAILLVIWHDPATWTAIDGSGGLGEVFTLPLFIVIPAMILGTLGGICGAFAGARFQTT